MRLFYRFFASFIIISISFSLVSFTINDYLFKREENQEEKRVYLERTKVQSFDDINDPELAEFISSKGITLEIIYTDEYNSVDYKLIGERKVNNNDTISNYKGYDDIIEYCDENEGLVSKETPRGFDNNFLIQTFCHNNSIFILTSPYVSYSSVINFLQISAIYSFIIIAICGTIISYFLAKYISKPISNMIYITNRISRLDFSMKADVSNKDELGELARHINILSNQLEQSIRSLQKTAVNEKTSREKQTQLFASMSHELKTPITIIKGTLEGIKDQVGPYKNPLNHIDDMIEEANTMESIVLNLLNYSKFSLDDIKLNFKPYSIEKILYEQLYRLDYLLTEKNIEVEINITDEQVLIDISSMNMVLKNIFENAIYYSPDNSKIEILASVFSTHVLINITNHGINISKDSLKHIFDPFYRDDNSRMVYKNGTGLGLTIVKQILDQHKSVYSIYNINDDEYAVSFEFTLKKANL